MIETLAFLGADEAQTMYGLLAEEMQVAPDKSSITFHLNEKARFSNGDPVTSEDVKFSYDTLTSPFVSPAYPTDYAGVSRAVVVDAQTIRFELKDKTSDQMFRLGRLPVFSRKYGMKADGSRPPFDQIVDEPPIASGAYTIARSDSGRRIEFQRNPNYWARDLPVRRGMYNFDRIVYRYYQDEDIATEAFKAGEYDIVRMYSAPIWTRQLRGPKFDSGQIVKRAIHVGTGQGLQAYELNLRRPIFQDIRVRHALVLTYDWETNNRYRDFGLKRASSVFNNSEFAAVGLPSPGELKLLEPFRDADPEGSVRAALCRAAHRHRPERPAPQPARGARAARGRRLEARRRRRAAQRQGRALRRRAARAFEPGHRPAHAALGPQRQQARHDHPRAPRRLRALQPAPRGVRLRPRLGRTQRREIESELREVLTVWWQTDAVRRVRPLVVDEVRRILFFSRRCCSMQPLEWRLRSHAASDGRGPRPSPHCGSAVGPEGTWTAIQR